MLDNPGAKDEGTEAGVGEQKVHWPMYPCHVPFRGSHMTSSPAYNHGHMRHDEVLGGGGGFDNAVPQWTTGGQHLVKEEGDP